MEYLDIVNEAGLPTGQTIERSIAHRDSILHRTAHVWVVRKNADSYDILLQKRSMEKDSFPGQYDTSSAGHIPAGEEPEESAVRELSEELGITAALSDLHYAGMFRIQYEKEFHGAMFRDNEVTWVYVYDNPVDINTLTLQASEVDEVRWFPLEEVWTEIQTDRNRFCVPTGGLEVLRRYLVSGDDQKAADLIYRLALESGYDDCGIIPIADTEMFQERLDQRIEDVPEATAFYSRFLHGMNTKELFPWAKSVIICTYHYGQFRYPQQLQGRYAKEYFLSPESKRESDLYKRKARFVPNVEKLGIRIDTGDRESHLQVGGLRNMEMHDLQGSLSDRKPFRTLYNEPIALRFLFKHFWEEQISRWHFRGSVGNMDYRVRCLPGCLPV